MDCSLPVSFVHGILQTRIMEWVAMPSSRRPFGSRDQICVSYISCIGRWVFFFFTTSTTWETQNLCPWVDINIVTAFGLFGVGGETTGLTLGGKKESEEEGRMIIMNILAEEGVNNKLALTKSIANDWTTKAFAICLYRDWTLCNSSCGPSTPPEGV